jgi:hypothetical protein
MKPSSVSKSPLSILAVVSVLYFAQQLLWPAASNAAERPEPFETMSLEATFLANVGRSEFHDYWDPSNGVQAEFGTPFYLGIVQIGVHVFNNDNVTDTVPRFGSAFVYLGWGYEWRLPPDVGWFAGIHAGGFYMNFDDDVVVDEGKTESELGLGLRTSVRYPTVTRWSALVTCEYRRIYTHRRIDYVFVGAGVSYTMATPGWLRGFLE